jgi:protein YIPF5/7
MFVKNSPFEDYNINDTESDPSLMEELGINPDHIKNKTWSILTFGHVDERLLEDPDMAGPLLYVLVFGGLLLLAGKIHFGAIYGFGLMGSIGIFAVLNLMSQSKDIDLYKTVSILGYALLPIVLLSAVGVFMKLSGAVGMILVILSVAWSTYTAASFFETFLELKEQRWLISYPICLLYACFTLLTIF